MHNNSDIMYSGMPNNVKKWGNSFFTTESMPLFGARILYHYPNLLGTSTIKDDNMFPNTSASSLDGFLDRTRLWLVHAF